MTRWHYFLHFFKLTLHFNLWEQFIAIFCVMIKTLQKSLLISLKKKKNLEISLFQTEICSHLDCEALRNYLAVWPLDFLGIPQNTPIFQGIWKNIGLNVRMLSVNLWILLFIYVWRRLVFDWTYASWVASSVSSLCFTVSRQWNPSVKPFYSKSNFILRHLFSVVIILKNLVFIQKQSFQNFSEFFCDCDCIQGKNMDMASGDLKLCL